MQLDQASRQREPDPQSAARSGQALLDLIEHFKDSWQSRGLDADAGVADGNDGLVFIDLRRERDAAAAIGVFDGVVQQVGKRLRQPREVAEHPQAGVRQVHDNRVRRRRR